jgi:hypothetical protein
MNSALAAVLSNPAIWRRAATARPSPLRCLPVSRRSTPCSLAGAGRAMR